MVAAGSGDGGVPTVDGGGGPGVIPLLSAPSPSPSVLLRLVLLFFQCVLMRPFVSAPASAHPVHQLVQLLRCANNVRVDALPRRPLTNAFQSAAAFSVISRHAPFPKLCWPDRHPTPEKMVNRIPDVGGELEWIWNV
jgi:hypothetical protein